MNSSQLSVLQKWVLPLGLICILIFFLHQRITSRYLPNGDEGSWMSVAAQVAKANGFKTSWLEFPFLKPYEVPRNDDFRYPGLVVILALAFKLFSIDYQVGLWTVTIIHGLFCLALFFLFKKFHGFKGALLALVLVVFSPLQLAWNSMVYTEGLFGLGLCFFIWSVSQYIEKEKLWWLAGLSLGLLYLTRPNALLLVSGFLLHPILFKKCSMKSILLVILAFATTISPWLVRNYFAFQNPFHFANSSALFMGALGDPIDMNPWQYFSQYGFVFQFQRVILGIQRFFHALNLYDEGLYLIPVAGLIIGVALRRPFFNHIIATGFIVSFFMCIFMAYVLDEAAVRYFTPFMPFIMGYGACNLLFLFQKLVRSDKALVRLCIMPVLAGLLLIPVFYPHRFYLRKYSEKNLKESMAIADYLEKMTDLLKSEKAYLAARMCQMNFMLDGHCIGIQHRDPEQVLSSIPPALVKFKPPYLVLTRKEDSSKTGQSIVALLSQYGLSVEPYYQNPIVIVYNIRRLH